MNRLLFIIFLFTGSLPAAGQLLSKENKEPMNAVKLNLGALVVRNFSLQYERQTGARTSVALGLRLQPYGELPFRGYIADRVDNQDLRLGESRMGNFAITPEFRYQLGKNAWKGFYIAPYLRYADFRLNSAVDYTSLAVQKTAFFTGHIHSFSGGILLGTQLPLSRNFLIDFWILGGHAGGSKGGLRFTASLNPQEQEDLRQTLAETDIPFFKIDYDINENGGTIRARGAWAGLRVLALNLVYRF